MMDRRKFLLNATVTAVAGCARHNPVVPPASAAVSQNELEKIHCTRNSTCWLWQTG
jgi:hypothetical protein